MVSGSTRNLQNHLSETKSGDILRLTAIFGANASGKTNVIKSMFYSKSIILGNNLNPNMYFRVLPENKEKGTSFEYLIDINDRRLAYGFEILLKTQEIKEEWLHDVTKPKVKKIFHREGTGVSTDLTLKSEQKRFDVYTDDLKPCELFLTVLSEKSFPENCELNRANEVFEWFAKKLRIMPAGNPVPDMDDYMDEKLINDIIGHFGTGVTSLKMENVDCHSDPFLEKAVNMIKKDVSRILPDFKTVKGQVRTPGGLFSVSVNQTDDVVAKKIMFMHKETEFEYPEESDGTQRLYDLLQILRNDGPADITFVIDELERSLHPQLTEKLVKEFSNLNPDLRKQLIFTTHESRLLNLDVLRRDEIRFANKVDESTVLYSLEDFNERGDRKIDNAYFAGRYDGIPCFKKIYPPLE